MSAKEGSGVREHPALAKVSRVIDVIQSALLVILVLITAAIALLLFIQVALRFIFHNSQSWIDETSRIAFIWMTFLGSAVLIRERGHLAIDFFTALLPDRVQRIIDFIINLALIALFVVLLSVGGEALAASSVLETPTLHIPRSFLTLAVLVGYALSLLYAIELFVCTVAGASPPGALAQDDEFDAVTRSGT